MKTSRKNPEFLTAQSDAQTVLNELYHTSKIKRLYQLPSFEKFSYTPFISALISRFEIVDIVEIIFFFKLNLIEHTKDSPISDPIEIILHKDAAYCNYCIDYYVNDILIHSANIGKRAFNFKRAVFILLENHAGKPFLLATPEEISDKNNFINL